MTDHISEDLDSIRTLCHRLKNAMHDVETATEHISDVAGSMDEVSEVPAVQLNQTEIYNLIKEVSDVQVYMRRFADIVYPRICSLEMQP